MHKDAAISLQSRKNYLPVQITLMIWLMFLVHQSMSELLQTSNFVDATPAMLTQHLQSQDWSVVIFYNPQCTHCKHFMPMIDQASESLWKQNGSKILRVNCGNSPELIVRYNIPYFPWLTYYKKTTFQRNLKTRSDLNPTDILLWISGQKADLTDYSVDKPVNLTELLLAYQNRSKSQAQRNVVAQNKNRRIGITKGIDSNSAPRTVYAAKVQAVEVSIPERRVELIKLEKKLPGFTSGPFRDPKAPPKQKKVKKGVLGQLKVNKGGSKSAAKPRKSCRRKPKSRPSRRTH